MCSEAREVAEAAEANEAAEVQRPEKSILRFKLDYVSSFVRLGFEKQPKQFRFMLFSSCFVYYITQ